MDLTRIFVCVVFTLMAALSGCAAKQTAENLDRLPEGKGLVLFSTSADETSPVWYGRMLLIQAETKKMYDGVVIQMNFSGRTYDFPEQIGNVRSLVLPEGEYYLAGTIGNVYSCATKYPLYKFFVRKGELSYLGGFYFQKSGYYQYHLNNKARDIAFFRANNPLLADRVFVPQILPAEPHTNLDCDPRKSFITGTIYGEP